MSKHLLCLVTALTAFMLQAQVSIVGEEVLNKIPWNFYYANSYSQIIYQSNLINASGEITGIQLYYADSSTEHSNQITLYLGHSEQSEFSNADNWVNSGDLTQVFAGEVNFVPGTWVQIDFDTPFDYNGDDNLVIAALENSNGFENNSDIFVTMPSFYTGSLVAFSDNNVLDPNTPPLYDQNGTTNVVYGYLPQIQFLGITPSCAAPTNISVSDITGHSAQILWEDAASAGNYEIVYKEGEDFNPYNDDTVMVETSNDVTINLDNLDVFTTYYAYVRATCDENDASTFVGPISFQTLAGAVEVPYTNDFEAGVFPPLGWRIENVSGGQWLLKNNESSAHSGTYALQYNFSTTLDADAWIFTVGVNLEANNVYDISFWQRVENSTYTEKLKLTVGTANTVDAQITTLWDNDNLSNVDYVERTTTFQPMEDGVYYFAFQAYSAADQYDILVDDFSIEEHTMSTANVASTEKSIILHPNPVKNGIVHIKSSQLTSAELDIKVYDVLGKVVLIDHFDTLQNDIELPVQHLPSGKYFLQYNTGEEQGSIPFIIK